MNAPKLRSALTAGLLSLTLPALTSAQEGVDWSSISGGTLGGSTVTTTGFVLNPSVSTSNFSTSNYSYAPLSASEPCIQHAANNQWSATFAPALPDGVLWYGSFTRGAGAFSGNPDTEYTFNHTPVIVSGFGLGTVTGNTLSLPESTFHWGILEFSGSIDTLTCTTNATGISFQSMTIGLPPDNSGPIGTPDAGCSAVANSSGMTGTMSGIGQLDVLQNDCELTASNVPLNQFCLLVASQTPTLVPGAGIGSNGNLCLAGNVARFNGQLTSSGASGSATFSVDLGAIPLGSGPVVVSSGETWYFQTWHRDQVGVGSNFTDSLCITFQ